MRVVDGYMLGVGGRVVDGYVGSWAEGGWAMDTIS